MANLEFYNYMSSNAAKHLKDKIEKYWNAPERYEKYGKYLNIWIECDKDGRFSKFYVRSNMINGLPPSPVVRDLNFVIKEARAKATKKKGHWAILGSEDW